ncbi:hypothetical protein LR48_Vigan09g005700 [Vigna angularis]|uniref:AMP-dependent synthetase/ligase domain-containing protein n=1 Tax=Phaseolus angularis TaxID=3914 RepID=A0A0L9V8Q8_PHAAN|nr:hypothetical protein LR48_Vigan09g005700 [Vigna angularis]
MTDSEGGRSGSSKEWSPLFIKAPRNGLPLTGTTVDCTMVTFETIKIMWLLVETKTPTMVEQKGGLVKNLFHFAYKRRLAAVKGSWLGAWGLEKFVWDTIVFKQIRSALGGQLRFMLCGGAPLSGDSQYFINICMGAPIGQGYGLTETFAGAAFSEWDDYSVGRVGPPLPCCYIKFSNMVSRARPSVPLLSPPLFAAVAAIAVAVRRCLPPSAVAVCQAKLRVRFAPRSATQPWWSLPQKPPHAPPCTASLRQVSSTCSSCAAFSVSDRHCATADSFAVAS